MAITTLTSKGQITIPQQIRNSLKLNTGDKIEIIVTKEREAVIRPVSKTVDEMFGILRQPSRKVATMKKMNIAIRERMRETFK